MVVLETREFEASVGKYVGKYGERTYTIFRVAIPKEIGEDLQLEKGDMVHLTLTPTGKVKADQVRGVSEANIKKLEDRLKKMKDQMKEMQKQKKE